MKMHYIAALLPTIALVLGGCYLAPDEGAGSVGVQLPGSDDPDQTVVDDEAARTARVYLLSGDSLVDLADTGHLQVNLVDGDQDVSVGPVPAGPGYQVILVLGALDGGSFTPARFAVSETFTVFAGQANEITPLSTQPVDFTAGALDGESLVGVMTDGTSLYAASSGELFAGTPALEFGDGIAVPAGQTVNSLSLGFFFSGSGFAPEPWLNTTTGILPYRGGAFDTDFSSALETNSILSSGSFGVGTAPTRNLYGFFQLDGGLGGLWVTDANYTTPIAWEWLDEVDLSEVVTGQPVYDFVVDGMDAVYFATKLGSFRLTSDLLTSGASTVQDIMDAAEFFTVAVNGQQMDVTEMALVGDTMYLATAKGVVQGSVVAGEAVLEVAEDAAVIPETANREVLAMAFGSTYGAILTNHFLVVTNNREDYEAIPIYVGTGGVPSDIFLDTATGTVLVAGSDGLLAVNIDAAVE